MTVHGGADDDGGTRLDGGGGLLGRVERGPADHGDVRIRRRPAQQLQVGELPVFTGRQYQPRVVDTMFTPAVDGAAKYPR